MSSSIRKSKPAANTPVPHGARYLGREAGIGTLAPGKRANLVLVKGDPAIQTSDVEHVEIVFKDGVGYDSAKLIDPVRGQVGVR